MKANLYLVLQGLRSYKAMYVRLSKDELLKDYELHEHEVIEEAIEELEKHIEELKLNFTNEGNNKMELTEQQYEILEEIKDEPKPIFAGAGFIPPSNKQKIAWGLINTIYAEQRYTHYLKITEAGIMKLNKLAGK